MPELISHPGLRFYVFELQGSLTYSLARNGRAPTTYSIHDFDIEDETISDSNGAQAHVKTKLVIDASAVGCRLQVIKNDGSFKIEFEGQHGSTASWSFEGLATTDGVNTVATAAAQTLTDPTHCSSCGKDTITVELKHQGTQSDDISMHSSGVQAEMGSVTTSTGMQTAPTSELPLHDQMPQAARVLGPFINTPAVRGLACNASRDLMSQFLTSRKILDRDAKVGESVEALKLLLKEERKSRMLKTKQAAKPTTKRNEPNTTLSSHIGIQSESIGDTASPIDHAVLEQSATASTNLKRKTSSSPAPSAPLHKRAKSTHDGPPWPRHLYMACFRSYPIFNGDVGMLHIDVEKATVWFEGWYGRPHSRRFERRQLDLRDPLTKVIYVPMTRAAVDNAKYDLQLAKPNPKGGITQMVTIDCAAPGWEFWGSDEPCVDEQPQGKRNLLPSAKVIVDAIIHCIDVTSGRQAVHDPDTMHAILEHDAQYQKSKDARTLSILDILDWGFTLDELKVREKRRSAVVICDIKNETDRNGTRSFGDDLAVVIEKHEATALKNSAEIEGKHSERENES